MKKSRILIAFLVGGMFLYPPMLNAQEETPKIRTYEENLKQWRDLSEEERQIIRKRAQRLSPAKISEMKEELSKFNNRPKDERDRIIGNYRKFNRFTPKEREAIKQNYEHFERLPRERRDAFRRQFREKKRVLPGESGGEADMRGQSPKERPGQRRDVDIRRENGQGPARQGNGMKRSPGVDRNPAIGRGGRGPNPRPAMRQGGNPPSRPRGGSPRGRRGPRK